MTFRVSQASFAGGELAPSMFGRVDIAKFQVGFKNGDNIFVLPEGGVSNRAGLRFVGEVKGGAPGRQIPFIFDETTGQVYSLVFTGPVMRVYRGGAPVLEAAQTVTAVTLANPGVFSCTAHGYSNGDELVLVDFTGMTVLDGRNLVVANATSNTFTLNDLFGNAVSTVGSAAYAGGGTVRRIYEVAMPYSFSHLARLKYLQDNDVMYLVHPSFAPRKLSRFADDNWTVAIVPFSPVMTTPGTPTVTKPGDTSGQPGYVAHKYTYKVAAVSGTTGEESLPSGSASVTNDLSIAGGINRAAWTAVSGASLYKVYRYDSGAYGYIGSTTALLLDDENITPDLAQGPQQGLNPFSGTGNYPQTVESHEQRLALAGTNNQPAGMYLSQPGIYENFGSSSPKQASDSIIFRIRGRERNEVRHIISMLGDLAVFSSSDEYVISGGQEDYLTPSNIKIKRQSNRGSSYLSPLLVGSSLLYNPPGGATIRRFGYDLQKDAYTGGDLTILAKHLFKGRSIKAWAYAQEPYSIVWVVLDNGRLLSLTYIEEQEVWAWSKHYTDGTFEDVIVLPEGGRDVPYFIVHREVNGVIKHYIERMETREFAEIENAFFVDSGLTYSGTPKKTMLGLWHLEGRDVTILADGNVITGLTVSNGSVTMANAHSLVHIGLGYEAMLETLPMDGMNLQGVGSSAGRTKTISTVTAKVERSRGVWVAVNEDDAVEIKQRQYDLYGEAMQPVTGVIQAHVPTGYDKAGSVIVGQSSPLPMTILSVMPDVRIGG